MWISLYTSFLPSQQIMMSTKISYLFHFVIYLCFLQRNHLTNLAVTHFGVKYGYSSWTLWHREGLRLLHDTSLSVAELVWDIYIAVRKRHQLVVCPPPLHTGSVVTDRFTPPTKLQPMAKAFGRTINSNSKHDIRILLSICTVWS